MVLVGASMLKGIRNVDTARLAEMLPFAATVIGAGVLGNIALGVALGCVSYVICKAVGRERRELSAPSIALGAVMLAFAVLALL